MSLIVYFSSSSENTHRFVQRLGLPAVRIPLNERERIQVDEPYILIVPSYGGGGTAGAVLDRRSAFLTIRTTASSFAASSPRATAILARPMAGLATSSSRNAAYRTSIVLN